tara:strand:- start:264 stop:758 length:495 start_codon:yes stop_codon:yes gene_type:complete
MNLNIKELRQLIKESILETYYGASSNFSQLDSPAFNRVGSKQKRDPSEPVDEVALTEKILSILASIEIPQSGDSYSDPSISESDIAAVIRAHIGGDAGFPVGDFGDKGFNHAAAEAAKVLIDNPEDLEGAAQMCARGLISPDAEYDRATTRMYEEIIAFPRNLR